MRKLDALDIAGALSEMNRLTPYIGKMSTMGRCILENDYRYCRAIMRASSEERLGMETAEDGAFVDCEFYTTFSKSMQRDLSVLRSECAVALLQDEDAERATMIYFQFQRQCGQNPWRAIVDSENDLMREAWAQYEESLRSADHMNGALHKAT